jgi:hypothetical protein
MSKTEKTYCSLYTFIKNTNRALYDILDDMCAVGLCRTRNDITFLNPNVKLTKQLTNMVDEGDSEEAYGKLKCLFIYGKHNSLNKDVVNYNNKKYSEDLTGLKQLSSFKQWRDSQNVSVFDYKSDKFPTEGESASRPPMQKSKGKGKKGKKGREDENVKILYTHELMNKKDYKQVIYALSSLFEHLKSNENKIFNNIQHLIDPNMILSWYILVQPGKDDDPYISNETFNEWAKNNSVEDLQRNKDVLEGILEKYETPREILVNNRQNRNKAKQDQDSLDICKRTINNIYNNDMTKLLEDELRFRYSDEESDEMFENYICTLTMIDWNNPADSLVLLKNINNMHNSAILVCLQKFIDSSAFNYTLLNNDMCKRLRTSIQGAGSGQRKKTVKILGHTHRNLLKETKSINTLDLIESLVSKLTPKEKTHLKSML